MKGRCVCGCGGRAVQLHHVVYQQAIRAAASSKRRGRLLKDKRNLVPVAMRCHGEHHARSRPFLLAVLPDAAFEFAAEVYGDHAAWMYLRRRYDGEDPRLDALVAEEVIVPAD